MKKYLTSFVVYAALLSGALAQSGQIPSGGVWGNSTASKAPGQATTIFDVLNKVSGCTTQNNLIARGASAWSCITTGSGIVTWFGTPSSANLAAAVTDETGSGALVFGTSPAFTTPTYQTSLIGTSTNSQCSAVGRQGATNPAFQVDCSTASQATGIGITGKAAAAGASLAVISSGSNENLNIDAKGSGSINLGQVSTGSIFLQRAVQFGVVGSVNGLAIFVNTTSGSISVAPPAGALGSVTNTLQAATDTFVYKSTPDALSNKTITSNTNVLGGVTMTLGSDAAGDVYYRDGSGFLTRLGIGSNGQVLTVNTGLPSWQAASSAGSITAGSTTIGGGCSTAQVLYNNAGTLGCEDLSSTLTAGNGVSVTGTTNPTIAVNLSKLTASLGADVNLNNIANYFDGPSVAQGTSGTWFASGTVTLRDTAGSAAFDCKLWDGTTVIASARTGSLSAAASTSISLQGYLATPAGNIRISCKDPTSTSGLMQFNVTGNSKDSTVSVLRVQ